MEQTQINIPQSTSTKSGEFELSFNNENDFSDFLLHRTTFHIGYVSLINALNNIKSTKYFQNFSSPLENLEKIPYLKKLLFSFFDVNPSSYFTSISYVIET